MFAMQSGWLVCVVASVMVNKTPALAAVLPVVNVTVPFMAEHTCELAQAGAT